MPSALTHRRDLFGGKGHRTSTAASRIMPRRQLLDIRRTP
jgi:hypothetical protein